MKDIKTTSNEIKKDQMPDFEAFDKEMLLLYDTDADVEKRLEIFSKQNMSKDLLLNLLLSEGNEKDFDFKAQAVAIYFVKGLKLSADDLIYILKEDEIIIPFELKKRILILASSHLTKFEKDYLSAYVSEQFVNQDKKNIEENNNEN
ncbi:MAG: hypothetical protein WCR30_04725 [Clostridia bacterium]